VVSEVHPLLRRQLRRLGLSADAAPELAGWQALLERLGQTYRDVDEERYTVERAFEISSREMQDLYEQLRRRSEQALAIERDKLARSLAIQNAALETMRDGVIVVGADRTLVAYNHRFAQLFAISAELLAQGDARATLRCVTEQIVNRDEFLRQVEHLYAHPTETAEDELVLTDGRIIERFSAPVVSPAGEVLGRLSAFRDVTSERSAEQAVRQANRFLDSVVENIPDMIFVKDAADLRFVSFNRAGERLLGLTRDQLIGHCDHDFFPAGQADFFVARDREVLASGAVVDIPQEKIQTHQGERILHTKKMAITDEAGTPRFLLGISRDVTDEIRSQDALRVAKDAAEQAAQAKSRFLANMSHELRTPLNAIVGFARILLKQRDQLSDTHHEYVGYVSRAAEHMLSLVNDLLDLRRLEEGRRPVALAEHDVGGMVDTALSMVAPLIVERGHALETRLDDGLAPTRCEPRAMVQILVNLLSNAAKYTPPGGQIRLRARESGLHTCIEVADTGIGIADADLPHLFDYFTQVGAKHQHHMQGSGVGLALTKELVDHMGGRLEVSSQVDRGSVFRVRIPRRAAP
jgi:PAS domain S-box-containing protein